MHYAAAFESAVSNSEDFWTAAAERVAWIKPPVTTRRSRDDGLADWYEGGTLNTCHLALDLHIEQGRGDQVALIYDSPASGKVQQWTYDELLAEVARLAGLLASEGVSLGDRVIIYLPMVPEAVFAMLACARIGAIHSVVFGGFAAKELATRIDDATPKVIISASCGHEPNRIVKYKPLLDAAIEMSDHKPSHCVIVQRDALQAELVKGRDIEWHDAHDGVAELPPVPLAASAPLIFSIHQEPQVSPKALSVIMVAMP